MKWEQNQKEHLTDYTYVIKSFKMMSTENTKSLKYWNLAFQKNR